MLKTPNYLGHNTYDPYASVFVTYVILILRGIRYEKIYFTDGFIGFTFNARSFGIRQCKN